MPSRSYARAMARDGVYTPQVVVNGRVKGDGLEPSGLAALMRQGDRGFSGPELGFAGGAVTVGAGTGAGAWRRPLARPLRPARD
jgi:hypothetical protein